MESIVRRHRVTYRWNKFTVRSGTRTEIRESLIGTYDLGNLAGDLYQGIACSSYTFYDGIYTPSGRTSSITRDNWYWTIMNGTTHYVPYPYFWEAENTIYKYPYDKRNYQLYQTKPVTVHYNEPETLVETVTSFNANAYPDNGISGDYWYIRI